MERFVVEAEAPLQRLLVEQALALAKELERAADSAPDGQVLDQCERVALTSGRESLRKALSETLEHQARAVEGEKGRDAVATAADRGGTRAARRVRS